MGGPRAFDVVVKQGELFPEFVEIAPTIAMGRGESFVVQCSWCGALLCAARAVKLGDCPACLGERPVGYEAHWWKQELPVGPFRSLLNSDEASER